LLDGLFCSDQCGMINLIKNDILVGIKKS
jgi:hypothetical protein